MKRPEDREGGQRLYDLLPRYVRYRDQRSTRSLEALFAVFQGPFDELRANMDQLYEGWFIETCAWWLVPYLGDLVAVRGLHDSERNLPTMRALVANTLAYRRRKGTRGALERALSNAVGCAVEVVDTASHLSHYQNLQTAEPELGSTWDVRVASASTGRGVDVRQDTFPSPVLQIRLWEAMAIPVRNAEPRHVGTGDQGEVRYTLQPFGVSMPLYHLPEVPWQAVFESSPETLPRPIRRSGARLRLESTPRYAEDTRDSSLEQLLSIEIEIDGVRMEAKHLQVANLRTWELPAAESGTRGVLDPRLGRLVLPSAPKSNVQVSYTYGGFGDLGGGPYETPTLSPSERRNLDWSAAVVTSHEVGKPAVQPATDKPFDAVFSHLELAIKAWNLHVKQHQTAKGCLRVLDSSSHPLSQPVLNLPPGSHLRIEAGMHACPFLQGSLRIQSSDDPAGRDSAAAKGNGMPRLELVGLWWEGQLQLHGRIHLMLQHCTLRPPSDCSSKPVITPSARRPPTSGASRPQGITVQSCLLGALRLSGRCHLKVADSVIDGGGGAAIAGSAATFQGNVALDSVTVLGALEGVKLKAVSCLLVGPVRGTGQDASTIAYCALVQDAEGVTLLHSNLSLPDVPFISRTFGDPGYARLDPIPLLRGDTDPSVLTAAEDGCELGAFRRSAKVWRIANLQTVLEEYLPLGLKTRITNTLPLANTARYVHSDSVENDDVR